MKLTFMTALSSLLLTSCAFGQKEIVENSPEQKQEVAVVVEEVQPETVPAAVVEQQPTISTGNYDQNSRARQFMADLAQRDGYDGEYLQSLLSAVGRDDGILAKMNRPAEKVKPWYEYQKIFSDAARTENGIRFYRENAAALQRAEQTYGVDPFIITAIIGVETRYGKVTGNTGVMQALTTLCFDYPKREKFFCEQLDYFMRLAKRENMNPLDISGSYAGAMGMGQFMPSSYYNDAIDFDGDGHVDLWHNSTDAIGSVANYLQKRGWQRGGSLILPLPVSTSTVAGFGKSHKPSIDIENFLQDPNLQNDENFIKEIGLHSGEKVGSLTLESAPNENQSWLTYNNFYVITRYNTSPLYAMAVIELAQRIKQNIIEST